MVERAEFSCEITWMSIDFALSGTLDLASYYRPPGYKKVKDQLEKLQDSS